MKRIKTKISLIIIIISSGIFVILGIKLYSKIGHKPNIILITFDALRADHLGCYGYPKNTSPFLDSISQESLTFTNCIAQSGSTIPSLSAIFTSQYPYTDGAVTQNYTLGEKYITLTEFLKDKGYNTFAIPGHYYVKKKFGFSRGFDYSDNNYLYSLNAEEISSRVINLLKKENTDNKFFLWVHIREPHSPYTPPQEYLFKFSEPAVINVKKAEEYAIYGQKIILTNQDIHELISRYDGNIRYADDNLKKIFDYLVKRGILQKSIVIITADHGESLGEHNIFDHNHLYYGILHVPLMIKIPGGKGKLINYPVSSIDIFPTILDILGYRKYISQQGLRGKSLLKKRKNTYIQFSEYQDIYSIIKENRRLHVDFSNNTQMLFNITIDSLENNNLINNHSDVYKLLFNDLQSILGSAKGEITISINKKDILDKEDIEHLKSLGYIN